MLGRPVTGEEFCQDLEHVVSSELSSDLDRHTLPPILVEYREKLQNSTIVRPCAHEVVRPDMIAGQRPEPDARAIVEPQTAPPRLPPRYLEPLLSPDPLHTLVIHVPAP